MTVNVSLWDEAAAAFRGLLRAEDKSQYVMLVTSVNPKLFGGKDHAISYSVGSLHLILR